MRCDLFTIHPSLPTPNWNSVVHSPVRNVKWMGSIRCNCTAGECEECAMKTKTKSLTGWRGCIKAGCCLGKVSGGSESKTARAEPPVCRRCTLRLFSQSSAVSHARDGDVIVATHYLLWLKNTIQLVKRVAYSASSFCRPSWRQLKSLRCGVVEKDIYVNCHAVANGAFCYYGNLCLINNIIPIYTYIHNQNYRTD